MKIKYFADTDTMFIYLKSGIGTDTLDIAPGMAVDVDAEGTWLRLEIYEDASKKIDLTSFQVEGLGFPAPVQEAAG